MQKITIIVNGTPYGTEGPYNALRLAGALLSGQERAEVNLFLMADAVFSAKRGQDPPKGYYDVEQMLSDVIEKGASARLCGTCSKARGIGEEEIVNGSSISSMIELSRLVTESDKVICF